jgi:hypothetical protein
MEFLPTWRMAVAKDLLRRHDGVSIRGCVIRLVTEGSSANDAESRPRR